MCDGLRFKDLQDREIEEGVEDGINLPSMEIARTFAVETIDHPHPLGPDPPFLPSLFIFSISFSLLDIRTSIGTNTRAKQASINLQDTFSNT